MLPGQKGDLEWVAEELNKTTRQLATGLPGPVVVTAIIVRLDSCVELINRIVKTETGMRSWDSPIPRNPGGNCGHCNEHIDGDVFKHVQKCRKDFEAKQAAKVRATAESLQRLAKDLEGK